MWSKFDYSIRAHNCSRRVRVQSYGRVIPSPFDFAQGKLREESVFPAQDQKQIPRLRAWRSARNDGSSRRTEVYHRRVYGNPHKPMLRRSARNVPWRRGPFRSVPETMADAPPDADRRPPFNHQTESKPPRSAAADQGGDWILRLRRSLSPFPS